MITEGDFGAWDKCYIAYEGCTRAKVQSLKAALYKAAEQVGFEVDPKWSNRTLGSKLITKFFNGPRDTSFKSVKVGSYVIERDCVYGTPGYGQIRAYHLADSEDEPV